MVAGWYQTRCSSQPPIAPADRELAQVPDAARVVDHEVEGDAVRPLDRGDRLLDISSPRPARDSLDHLLRCSIVCRDAGAGRPTKKERREIDAWWDGQVEE